MQLWQRYILSSTFFFQDPTTEIIKLAEYLDVTCSSELAADIADKCSFQNLKSASDDVKDHGEIKRIMTDLGLELPKFYRKGNNFYFFILCGIFSMLKICGCGCKSKDE
jgi:hypothetical protein